MVAVALVAGCGGADDDEHELGPNCQAISDACHDADEAGVDGAAECHETAHHADEDACEAELDACTTTCDVP
jgi:hypothetical protein